MQPRYSQRNGRSNDCTMIFLENNEIELFFDSGTGALTGLRNKLTGWQVIRQPKLAGGLRMLVPIERHRNNRVLPEKQALTSAERIDGNALRLTWEGLMGDKSGILDIDAELTIRLAGDAVSFDLMLRNGSPYRIEEVWMPYLGGLREPRGGNPLRSLSVTMVGGFKEVELGPNMTNQIGYWGSDYPGFLTTSPDNGSILPFVLLQAESEGIYIGQHSNHPSVVSFLHEFKPGYADSLHNRIADSDEIGGKPAGFTVSAIRLPFVEAGETVTLPPMVLRMYAGSWHEGIQTYASWRSSDAEQYLRPSWVSGIDAWMTLHVDSPEGCDRYTLDDIITVAREAKVNGVGVLQLIGWTRGGQDGDEPYQDVNPLLGSHEQFREMIRVIEQDVGIRVLLMCKFKWADRTTLGFREELQPLTMKDMYGDDVYFQGYAYQTVVQQLNGAGRRTGAMLCHSSASLRDIAKREFAKILELGSSGMLYDELTSDDRLLCFSGAHGHRYGACNSAGSVELAREFRAMAIEANPQYLMAGEGPNDYLTPFYGVNYVRTNDGWSGWEKSHTPAWKFMDPDMMMATCLTGWDDREMVHQCIAYGYVLNYEPYNFKGRLSDIPDTVAYGQAANELRRSLREYLWEGIFRDTIGLQIERLQGEGELLSTVFVHRGNGKRAIVLGNQSKEYLRVRVGLDAVNDGEPCRTFDRYMLQQAGGAESNGVETLSPRTFMVLVER